MTVDQDLIEQVRRLHIQLALLQERMSLQSSDKSDDALLLQDLAPQGTYSPIYKDLSPVKPSYSWSGIQSIGTLLVSPSMTGESEEAEEAGDDEDDVQVDQLLQTVLDACQESPDSPKDEDEERDEDLDGFLDTLEKVLEIATTENDHEKTPRRLNVHAVASKQLEPPLELAIDHVEALEKRPFRDAVRMDKLVAPQLSYTNRMAQSSVAPLARARWNIPSVEYESMIFEGDTMMEVI